MDQFQAAAIGFVFAVSAQTINRWGKGNHDQTHNERKDGKFGVGKSAWAFLTRLFRTVECWGVPQG